MYTSGNDRIVIITIIIQSFTLNAIINSCNCNKTQEYSGVKQHRECDYTAHENGCPSDEGMVCLDNKCMCIEEYIELNGECLRPALVGEPCLSSKQCSQLDANAQCFAIDDRFQSWICQCHQDYYYDTNNSTGSGKCTKRLLYGEKCQNTDQCFSGHSVCNSEGTTDHCICEHNYTFDATTNQCRHNGSYSCGTEEEWNQLSGKCQPKHYYSHKGGGRGGGGRGGRGGGRGGGGGAIRSSGRSWWTTSWIGRRGVYVGGGPYGSGSRQCREGHDCPVAWEKVLVVLGAILVVVMACCYCSYKFRQQDKEAAAYWAQRSRRPPVPRIVVRGADTGVTSPLLNATAAAVANQKRLSRTSMEGIGNHTGAGVDSGHHSRSGSAQHSRANSRTSSRGSTTGRPPGYGPHTPDSPPPPYSPPAGGVILPFASGSQQHIQLASGERWPPAAPPIQRAPSQRRLPSPQPLHQQSRRHSAVDDMFYRRSPSRSPLGARQSTPLSSTAATTQSTVNTLGYGLRLQRQQSRSQEYVNRRPSGAHSPVRHPLNPDLILPFATGPVPAPTASPCRTLPTAPPVDN